MIPYSLLLPLAIRSLSLLLPQTFFQPDEFYQALEPAHHLVFGYGHLTWEWKDLPIPSDALAGSDDWWTRVVVGGRMRSWFWPSVFDGVYRLLRFVGLDQTDLLVFAPRVVGVLVAALTDYSTSCLARKLLGSGASAGALFLSLTSLFNAHLLPRSLSTSPETLLTTAALLFFPLPQPDSGNALSKGREPLKMDNIIGDTRPKRSKDQESKGSVDVPLLDDLSVNHVLMDRADEQPFNRDSLSLSVVFAGLAICIRPTTLPFWTYMGLEHLIRTCGSHGLVVGSGVVARGVLSLLAIVIASTALDYTITGRITFPILTFIHRNVFANISSFYGGTHWTYHLVRSLPIMLFPIWFWWIQGYLSSLLPASISARIGIPQLDRPPPMRALARGTAFGIAVLSLSAHSEWRFLHPFLPALLIFALPPMFRSYEPTIMGCWRVTQSIRQYTRLPKSAYYTCLLLPILPWLYLSAYHGRAQVEVMNVLRRGEVGNVTGLVALMPCHSTPWQSHLHKDIDAWFLTCEPPLDPRVKAPTQQDLFYASLVAYIKDTFPMPPGPQTSLTTATLPSHVILFGNLLEQTDSSGQSASLALRNRGYQEVWSMWNGFDLAQDEPKRRGGVRIWSRTRGASTPGH